MRIPVTIWSKINSTQWLPSAIAVFFLTLAQNWPRDSKKADKKDCSRVPKIKILCFFKTKHYKTGIFWSIVHYSEENGRGTLCLDHVYELLPKNQAWHFSFCKVREDFREENFLICTPPCLDETKRICNSGCSGFDALVFSSALSTPKTTEKFKI